MWDISYKRATAHHYYCPNTALTILNISPGLLDGYLARDINFKEQRVVHFVCHDGTEDLFLYVYLLLSG